MRCLKSPPVLQAPRCRTCANGHLVEITFTDMSATKKWCMQECPRDLPPIQKDPLLPINVCDGGIARSWEKTDKIETQIDDSHVHWQPRVHYPGLLFASMGLGTEQMGTCRGVSRIICTDSSARLEFSDINESIVGGILQYAVYFTRPDQPLLTRHELP